MALDTENAVKAALALAGAKPIRGTEYFDISCLALILDVAEGWLAGQGAVITSPGRSAAAEWRAREHSRDRVKDAGRNQRKASSNVAAGLTGRTGFPRLVPQPKYVQLTLAGLSPADELAGVLAR